MMLIEKVDIYIALT